MLHTIIGYIFVCLSDCFEEIPYDGKHIKFNNPITNKQVPEINVRSAKSCQLICQKEALCKYFTWISSSHISYVPKCFLKSDKNGEVSAKVSGGNAWLNTQHAHYKKILSGPKYCITGKYDNI